MMDSNQAAVRSGKRHPGLYSRCCSPLKTFQPRPSPQLTHYFRQLSPGPTAIKRVAAQMRASASGRGSSAQALLPSERELEARAAPVAAQLEAAARAVAALRDASGYHWVQVRRGIGREGGRAVVLPDPVLTPTCSHSLSHTLTIPFRPSARGHLRSTTRNDSGGSSSRGGSSSLD